MTALLIMYSLEVDPDLGLGSWEDGVMDENSDPFPQNTGTEVYTNCWSNVWEWGHGDMAYKFANADYKVIVSKVGSCLSGARSTRSQSQIFTKLRFV